jgi:hypothetical protein
MKDDKKQPKEKKPVNRMVLGYNVRWIKNEAGKLHPDYEKVKNEAIKLGVWGDE